MEHFRALTMGKPVVMGRKTYLSIGKPLKGRTMIVVSRDRGFAAPGILVAPSLDAALAVARGDALRRGAKAIIVVGGADIYAQAMPLATQLASPMCTSASKATRVSRPSTRKSGVKSRERAPAGGRGRSPFDSVSYERADRALQCGPARLICAL